MADITMCSNALCPSSEECYRFMATPTPQWQSYSDFSPTKGEARCNYFCKLEKISCVPNVND